jgi:hypothetical protein
MEQVAIVVPESAHKRTKKERTPAQLEALKKGRDAHSQKAKERREKETAQSRPSTPVQELPRRREETLDFVELKNLKKELKAYQTKNMVRDLVAEEVVKLKQLKDSLKKTKVKEVKEVKDVKMQKVEKPVITFTSRRYGMLSPID